MEKSDSIIKLTGALIKAQGEIQVVEKTAENPFFKSKYADLPAIFKEYQKSFLKHGLAVIQIVEGKALRTTLAHESGEFVSGLADLLLTKQDPQGMGSAITYMRRYALAAICGIVSSEDDDDGNAGSKPEVKQEIKQESKPKHDPHAAAPLAPPADGKKAIGKITSYKPGTIFHEYEVDGVKLSAKKPALIEAMNAANTNGEKVCVVYMQTQNGKYTNNYIAEVIPVISDEVPF